MECVQTQHNLSRAFIETRLDGYVVTSDVSLCILNKHVLTLWMLDGFITFTLQKVQGNIKKNYIPLSIWLQWDSSPKNVINVFPNLYDFCETQKKGE